jgi:RNA polymerase sigma-70 factor (ECF subfamily)
VEDESASVTVEPVGATQALDVSGDFDSAVLAHWAAMTRLARRLAVDEWQDVLQAALETAYRRRARLDPRRGTLRNWLLAIVVEQCRPGWRRLRREQVGGVADRAGTDPFGPADARLDVERAIATLPERQRQVVTLYYFLDLSVADIAGVLSRSIGTIKSTLHDARVHIGAALEDYRA